jgi:adenosylcobinamide-GDP ribazoletransferase
MCILSRFTFVFLIYLFPYARQEGKLKVFRQEINLKILLYATAITVISIAVIWKIKGLLLLILIPVCACSMGKFIDKKIGGITGDTLGAIGEITEVIVLFGIISLDKISL